MSEFRGSQNYVASEELMRAVNIAMVLQKPLLIKGEPGTGKTMLAEAISQALGRKLIIWNIKSTTKAQDLSLIHIWPIPSPWARPGTRAASPQWPSARRAPRSPPSSSPTISPPW